MKIDTAHQMHVLEGCFITVALRAVYSTYLHQLDELFAAQTIEGLLIRDCSPHFTTVRLWWAERLTVRPLNCTPAAINRHCNSRR
jgi:hypothetical protein